MMPNIKITSYQKLQYFPQLTIKNIILTHKFVNKLHLNNSIDQVKMFKKQIKTK